MAIIEGKKIALASFLEYTGILRVLRSTFNRNFVVFNYHRISIDENTMSKFDDGVFGHTVSLFEQHISWLAKNMQVISEDAIIYHLEKDTPMPPRSVLITFDDGYKDNYTLAYPVLKKYNIPAIFFIPTAHIEARVLGWWDYISYLIKNTAKNNFLLDGTQISLRDKNKAIAFLKLRMKLEPAEKTEGLIQRLSSILDTPMPSKVEEDMELMTWDEIREVQKGGIAIGSHSHSHRVLATLSPDVQVNEMRQSKQILENKISKTVHSIAYPVGGYEHFTEETMKLAKQCGYKIGLSFNTGVNSRFNIPRFDVKRVIGPRRMPMLYGLCSIPQVFIDL